jgi:hypothetical protein
MLSAVDALLAEVQATLGQRNVSPNYQDVDLWDLATGKERTSLLDHRGAVNRMAFSADVRTLVVGSCRYEESGRYFGEVRLWDLATGKERGTLKERPGSLRNLVLSPDGKLLVLQEEQVLGGGGRVDAARPAFRPGPGDHFVHQLEALPVEPGVRRQRQGPGRGVCRRHGLAVGRYPGGRRGARQAGQVITGSQAAAPGESWKDINGCLLRGFRGLPAGGSLALLLENRRG